MGRRRCGVCCTCCVTLGVPALGKAPDTPCPHVVPGLCCDSYAARPSVCRHYNCLWATESLTWWRKFRSRLLQGRPFIEMLDAEDRPDRSRVQLDLTQPNSGLLAATGYYLIVARGVDIGALDTEPARATIAKVVPYFPVLELRGDAQSLLAKDSETADLVMRYVRRRKAGAP